MATSSEAPSLPRRSDYGEGCYRRSILLESGEGEVRGELADDFHHFGVRLRHDGARTLAIEGEGIRVPWTTCPGALVPLQRMRGALLADDVLALFRHTAPREQCTHLHDLACLAATHAARGLGGGADRRRYEVALPDRREGATTATLARDGTSLLRWELRGQEVERAVPAAWSGRSLGGRSFLRHLLEETDLGLREAAWILQRAIFVGMGRRHDFDAMSEARMFAPVVGAACHTFAPERVGEARRVRGTVRDFSDAPDRVLVRDR